MMDMSIGLGAATLVVMLLMCAFLTSISALSAYAFSLLAGLLVTGVAYRIPSCRRKRF